MKKVILGIILLLSVSLMIFSYIKLDNVKNQTKNLEKEISNIEKKMKKAKEENTNINKELTTERENASSLTGELEIWEKAKEKLKKAL